MHKRMLRLLALMLTLAMALSLAACGQDAPAEETKGEEDRTEILPDETVQEVEKDPLVRMYFPVLQTSTWEQDGETHTIYSRYYYPSGWFREESFTVKVDRENEDGEELLSYEETYSDHMVTRVYYEENGESKGIWLFDDNGNTLVEQYIDPGYVRMINDTTFYTYTRYYIYDTHDRLVATHTIYTSEFGESDVEVIKYKIEEIATGYISRPEGERDLPYVYEYDSNNRLVTNGVYDYLYNEAGAVIKVSTRGNKIDFSETKYEVVEVPLSVARRFCRFKWEYIE